MTTGLKMSLKEADRLTVVKRIENKELSIGDGARALDISPRQMKRVWKRYKQKGAQGLISLRRGKPSVNKLSQKLCQKAIAIVRGNYWDYGPTLAAEKLREK